MKGVGKGGIEDLHRRPSRAEGEGRAEMEIGDLGLLLSSELEESRNGLELEAALLCTGLTHNGGEVDLVEEGEGEELNGGVGLVGDLTIRTKDLRKHEILVEKRRGMK